MSHSHSSLLELPLFSHPTLFVSLLLPSRGNHQPLDPRTAGRFGRWTIQSPLTGYGPNAIVEISSTKINPVHFPLRRTSFCSEDNSGEDVTTTPVSSEVHERRSIRRLTSPLLMQKREASAVPPRIYHFPGQNMSSSSHTRSTRRHVAINSHRRRSSRDPRSAQETHITGERIRTEQQEVRDQLKKSEPMKQPKETRIALFRLSEAEFHTRLLLDGQRNQVRTSKF